MLRNIVVGVSGGVDSTVAALLLKRKGYNVTAVFLRNWDTADETGKCLADEDYKDAAYVCKRLDIPLVEVNFVKEYWNDVFSYLLESYQTGYTPNPDIVCNKNIKFDKFYNYARNILKADAIATGHYANTSFGPYLEHFKPNTRVKLLESTDTIKDQTFFLSQVNQEPLQRCMFPLANYHKSEVKKIALEAGLDVIAQKHESMGICFIGTRTFQNFIAEYVENKPGNFIDYETGKVMGNHQGIHYWTLGQRCRIGGLGQPYFIFQKNVETNDILIVPGTDHPALYSKLVIASKPHWIDSEPQELVNQGVLNCEFRFQRNQPLVSCKVFKTVNEKLIIDIAEPQRAMSPGQFAVLYLNGECLGSAPIISPGPCLYNLGKSVSQNNDNDCHEIPDVTIPNL